MDFGLFGVGSLEILLVLILALVVWGPGRLVEIGRILGKTLHAFRKAASDFTAQITKEMEEEKERTKPADGQGDDVARP